MAMMCAQTRMPCGGPWALWMLDALHDLFGNLTDDVICKFDRNPENATFGI